MPALPTPQFQTRLRRPLPHPLAHKSYRVIAQDIGLPASTVNRFLNNPDYLTKRHMDALLGTYAPYGVTFDALFELREYRPVLNDRRVILPPADEPTYPPKVKTKVGAFGRLVPDLGPDEQRTPPPNLNPANLYHPQSPAEKRQNTAPTKRLMTEDEFCTYDPKPTDRHPRHPNDPDRANPAWYWWKWRFATRPGTTPKDTAYMIAPLRALAELDGDNSERAASAVTARARVIMRALQAGEPIPPFDPTHPDYQLAKTKRKHKTK